MRATRCALLDARDLVDVEGAREDAENRILEGDIRSNEDERRKRNQRDAEDSIGQIFLFEHNVPLFFLHTERYIYYVSENDNLKFSLELFQKLDALGSIGVRAEKNIRLRDKAREAHAVIVVFLVGVNHIELRDIATLHGGKPRIRRNLP